MRDVEGLPPHQFPKIFIFTVGRGPYLMHSLVDLTLTPTFVPLWNKALKGRGSMEVQSHPIVHCCRSFLIFTSPLTPEIQNDPKHFTS